MDRFFTILLFLLSLCAVQGSVLGIDFGTQFMKIAIVRPGSPFEIVTDLSSKRKTPSAVIFDDSTRTYGYDALTMGARKPKNIFLRMSKMLGQGPKSTFASEFEELKFPYEFKLTERNTWSVKFPTGTGFDDVEYLTAEEINAMILDYARNLGVMFDNGQKIVDCVITVPCYFTQHERQAILDAASLIGLNVLSLIDETTAAALQYTVNKEFVNKTHRVMFYDMGAGSVQVSIAEFHTSIDKKTKLPKRYFDILSKAWDETLGGAHLSRILSDKFAQDFIDQHHIDPRGNLKVEYRLRALGEKLKEMLSVNEKLPVNEGTLFEERDLSTLATKQYINENSEAITSRLLAPALKALEEAGLKSEDLQAVEIIGGSIRVPIFQKVLKEGLHREELDMHLNGDETVALGSAFRAANVSTSFKPRFVGMSDICPYSIGVELYRTEEYPADETPEVSETPEGDETPSEGLTYEEEKKKYDFLIKNHKNSRSMELFTHNSHYKIQRKITLQAYENFLVHLYYSRPEELAESAVLPISTYNITGIAEGIQTMGEKRVGQPNVTLVFTNDMNGIVSLKDAYLKIRYLYQEEVEIEKPKNEIKKDPKDTSADEKKGDDKKGEEKKGEEKPAEEKPAEEKPAEEKPAEEKPTEEKPTEEKPAEEAETPATEEKPTEEKPTEEKSTEEKPTKEEKPVKEKKETVLVTKRKIRKMSLRVTSLTDRLVILPLSDEERQKSIDLLKRMQKRDDDHREHQRIINQHESFIYDSQSRLEDDEFIEFSSEEERQEISQLLTENEDWLMDEATNLTPTEEYKKRYLDMKTAMNRVENRIDDYKKKLEEERKKKEEEERKKKEEEEKKKKEEEEQLKQAAEAAKNSTAEATEATEESTTQAEATEATEESTTQAEATSNSTASETTAEKETQEEEEKSSQSSESSDEGFCSIDGNGCSDEI